MDIHRFRQLLDTCGADLERWPQEHRRAAGKLMNASAVARQMWAAARPLDALFVQDRVVVSEERTRRIMLSAMQRVRMAPVRSMDWSWLFSRPMGAVLAATLLMGCVAGFATSRSSFRPDTIASDLYALFAEPERVVGGVVQ